MNEFVTKSMRFDGIDGYTQLVLSTGAENFKLGDKDFTIDFKEPRRGLRWKGNFTPPTRTYKGDKIMPDISAGEALNTPMTIKRHKQISDLSYEVLALINKKVPDMKHGEWCLLGSMMEKLQGLK